MTRAARAVGAAVLVFGCEQVIGAEFDDAEPLSGTSSDAGGCELAHPPVPPDIADVGGDIGFTVVIHHVDYGEEPNADGTPGYFGIGFDLDDRCTNRGDEPECVPPSWTGGDPTDGPRGQDNGTGRLLVAQETLFGLKVLTSRLLNEQVAEGAYAPLGVLRISGYGGFARDDAVTVDWFVPVPTASDPGGAYVPLLDGTDSWPIAASSVVGGETAVSVYRDEGAYVEQFSVVARFPRLLIPFANINFEVVDVVLTGELTRETGQWRLRNGVVGGKSSSKTLLKIIPEAAFVAFGVSLCTDSANYPEVKQFVCLASDIPFGDAPPADGICDGTSFGVAFETVGASVGPIAPDPVPPDLCTPDTNPANDECTKAPE